MFLLTFLFVLLSFYWRERLKYLLSMSFPTIATWLSIKSLLTLIIVKDPTCLWNLCFGSVLLRYTSNSFPGTSYGSRLSLGFFIFLLLLSGALLKVWCRQSKVNRLFNLFLPCQETLNCEITEQKLRLRRLFKNSHRTSRCWQQPQPSPWQRPLWAPEYKHGDKRVNQAWPYKKKPLRRLKKGLLKAQLVIVTILTIVTTVWKHPGDHSRTKISPPDPSLLRPRWGKSWPGRSRI